MLQERLAIRLVDPVLDLDQHRAVVGQRLHGDGHVRQLRAGHDVLVLAQTHAHAPVHREQEQQQARRREQRHARVGPRRDQRPRRTLPAARLACTASRFIDTARARTHAGAALCVPAPRLASTPTQAAPAPQAPTSATAVIVGGGDERGRDHHSSAAATTTVFSECFCSSRGIGERADDRAGAEAAEEQAEAAGAEAQLVARDDGHQRPQRAGADGKAQVADDERAHRRRMPRRSAGRC